MGKYVRWADRMDELEIVEVMKVFFNIVLFSEHTQLVDLLGKEFDDPSAVSSSSFVPTPNQCQALNNLASSGRRQEQVALAASESTACSSSSHGVVLWAANLKFDLQILENGATIFHHQRFV